MILPQELEVFYVIPAIRKELAVNLRNQGLSQKAIAQIFQVSPACINNYFKEKRAGEVKFNQAIKKLINKSSIDLLNNKSCYIQVIQKLCSEFKKSECLCELHKKMDHQVCGCKGCLK